MIKLTPNQLDQVLNHLIELEDCVHKCEPIREDLGLEKSNLDAVLTRFDVDGVLTNIHEVEEEDGYFAVRLSKKGRAFINDGGYSISERRRKNSNNWKLIQTLITIIIAFATVVVSIKQCQISRQTIELQRQVDTLRSK